MEICKKCHNTRISTAPRYREELKKTLCMVCYEEESYLEELKDRNPVK